MHATFACTRCGQVVRTEVAPACEILTCRSCGQEWALPHRALDGGRLEKCLVCPSTDLFVRKDFPQRLGVAIVAVGFAASCVPWYFRMSSWTFAILFATALLDVLLYLYMGNCLSCYRCGARYRNVEEMEGHGGFSLDTHERHRQQTARLAETEAKR